MLKNSQCVRCYNMLSNVANINNHKKKNKCVQCNNMLSNVENINNHREKNQEMPNPMQRGAKVFSNLKIFKAAKRTLP